MAISKIYPIISKLSNLYFFSWTAVFCFLWCLMISNYLRTELGTCFKLFKHVYTFVKCNQWPVFYEMKNHACSFIENYFDIYFRSVVQPLVSDEMPATNVFYFTIMVMVCPNQHPTVKFGCSTVPTHNISHCHCMISNLGKFLTPRSNHTCIRKCETVF